MRLPVEPLPILGPLRRGPPEARGPRRCVPWTPPGPPDLPRLRSLLPPGCGPADPHRWSLPHEDTVPTPGSPESLVKFGSNFGQSVGQGCRCLSSAIRLSSSLWTTHRVAALLGGETLPSHLGQSEAWPPRTICPGGRDMRRRRANEGLPLAAGSQRGEVPRCLRARTQSACQGGS